MSGLDGQSLHPRHPGVLVRPPLIVLLADSAVNSAVDSAGNSAGNHAGTGDSHSHAIPGTRLPGPQG